MPIERYDCIDCKYGTKTKHSEKQCKMCFDLKRYGKGGWEPRENKES